MRQIKLNKWVEVLEIIQAVLDGDRDNGKHYDEEKKLDKSINDLLGFLVPIKKVVTAVGYPANCVVYITFVPL